MDISLDTRELREFSADMRQVPGELARHVTPLLKRGAVQIKRQLTEEMRASTHFAKFADFSFDVTHYQGFGGGEYKAAIGPRKDGKVGRAKPYKRPIKGRTRRPAPSMSAGAGANIAYFGTSRGGGTVKDPKGALEDEAPRFEKALADLVEKLI